MFEVIAFSESVDPGGALGNVAGTIDDTHNVQGDFIYIGELTNLIGFYVIADGTTAVNFQIQTPSLRDVALIDGSGVMVGTDVVDGGIAHMFPENPIALVKGEGMEFLLNSNPGAAAQQAGVIFLSDGALTPVSGEVHTIRGTATVTGAVNTWVSEAIVWDDVLPVGRYQCVGARIESANLMAARFITPGVPYRPGPIPVCDDDDRAEQIFRRGGLGVWFEFDSNVMPQLEVLTGSTSTAQTVYLDIIKI